MHLDIPFVRPESLTYPERAGAAMEQWAKRELHEPDFAILRRFAGQPTVVFDVGGNIGNSIVSIAVAHAMAQVHSFDPNPGLWPVLAGVAGVVPCTVHVHHFGLAERDEMVNFYIPVVDGTHIVGEASPVLAHFNDTIVSDRLRSYSAAHRFDIVRTEVAMRHFDGLEGLPLPDFVKIDVEGAEREVLHGMRQMLTTHSPCVMVETDRSGRVDRFMMQIGYEPYLYDVASDRLYPRGGEIPLNSFYLHARTPMQWRR
jgi:FkbM family methyltransferase